MWVMSGNNEVSIFFELNFKSKPDIALARIFMLTLKDLKAPKVTNAQSIVYYDRNFPERVSGAFPGAKTSASNGVVSLSISKSNIEKGIDQPLAFVVGFRQYLGYHLDAVKITMHTRMR